VRRLQCLTLRTAAGGSARGPLRAAPDGLHCALHRTLASIQAAGAGVVGGRAGRATGARHGEMQTCCESWSCRCTPKPTEPPSRIRNPKPAAEGRARRSRDAGVGTASVPAPKSPGSAAGHRNRPFSRGAPHAAPPCRCS
jgi:hypothetical protein